MNTAGPDLASGPAPPVLVATELVRRFGDHVALAGLDLDVHAGEVHALLGPNGAGKTTLMRILAGVTQPTHGWVELHLDGRVIDGGWDSRALVGLVPSGDRSFYLRLTGLQNLAFFARLHGLRRRAAVQASLVALDRVGLADAAHKRVGLYSHGMGRRLSVARALLASPPVLLLDEATHDLDPDGAETIRRLVRELAADGTAVVWTTQRLDEIRGFADTVTLLRRGELRFRGTVAQLVAAVDQTRYVLRLGYRDGFDARVFTAAQECLAGSATLELIDPRDPEHYRLTLADGAPLGLALTRLSGLPVDVLGCREERSGVEEAFVHLTAGAVP